MSINTINFNILTSAILANLKKLGFQHISIKHNEYGDYISCSKKDGTYMELFVNGSITNIYWNFDKDWSPRSMKLNMVPNEVVEFIRNF